MRLLLATILLLSCSHPQDASPSDLDAVKAQRDYFVSHFSDQNIERCDRITFAALAAAFGAKNDISKYEVEPGKWARDTAPCYPADSKSECSLDGYLSVLHWIVSTGDTGAARRILSHLSGNGWICGSGPESVTSIKPLDSVIRHMAGQQALADSEDAITGFRGHLLASYMWLRQRLGLGVVPGVFRALAADVPSSPFYAALAGDESRAVDRLLDFPSPYSQFWGSAPDDVVYMASVAVLEGT